MGGPRKLGIWVSLLLFLGGTGLSYLGWKLSYSWLLYLGLLPVGAAVVFWGLQAIWTRRSSYDSSEGRDATRTYTGCAAMLDGLSLVLIGAGIAFVGLAGTVGLGDALWEHVRSRPGLAMIFIGCLIAVYSSTTILGAREENRGSLNLLVSLPGRLFAIACLLAALALVLLGGLEIVFPERFDQWFGNSGDYSSPSK